MTTRAQVVWTAATQLGVKENPAGSNRQPYGRWYGLDGVAWCAIFGAWVLAKSGWGDPRDVYGTGREGWQYTPGILALARGRGIAGPASSAQPGDGVLFNFPGGDSRADHYGTVEKNTGSGLVCIEGNTALGNDSNGGAVLRRGRSYSQVAAIIKFPFASAPASVPPPPKPDMAAGVDWAQLRINLATDLLPKMQAVPDLHPGIVNPIGVWVLQSTLNLVAGGGLVTDSDYGQATAVAVGNVQSMFGLHVDPPLCAFSQTRFVLVKLLEKAAAGQ